MEERENVNGINQAIPAMQVPALNEPLEPEILDIVNNAPWNVAPMSRYKQNRPVVIILGILGLVLIGLYIPMLALNDQTIYDKGCIVRMDILQPISLGTLLGIITMIILVTVVPLTLVQFDRLLGIPIIGLLVISPYTVGLMVTQIIFHSKCSSSRGILVLYWINAVLLLTPFFLLFVGMIVIFLVFLCCGPRNYYRKQLNDNRRFNSEIKYLLKKYLKDPARATPPHMIFVHVLPKDDRHITKFPYITQEYSQPLKQLTTLYHGQYFGYLKLDVDKLEKDKKIAEEEAAKNQEAQDEIDSDDEEDAVEINAPPRPPEQPQDYPRIQKRHFSLNSCPVCQNNFKQNSLIILVPCCNQSYHQSCYFSKVTTNWTCAVCDCDMLVVIVELLRLRAQKDEAKLKKVGH